MSLHLERALFVVAPRNSGKSTVLRSMFLDRRLGTAGKIPSKARISDIYLSNERRLHMRITSPHEAGETQKEFLMKAKNKMPDGRWCFASPLHPHAFKNMPDAVTTVRSFFRIFHPERTRIVFISPNHKGERLDEYAPGQDLVKDMLSIDKSIEVICIDNGSRLNSKIHNGLLLADYFDFT